MNPTLKRHLISGATTFAVAFIVSLGAQLESYHGSIQISSAFFSGLLFTAFRAAVKAGVEWYYGASGDTINA